MNIEFNKHGVYMCFGLSEKEELLLLCVSDKKQDIKLPEKNVELLTALELEMCGFNPSNHHGPKHMGGCKPCILKYKSHKESDYDIVFYLESDYVTAELHYDFFEDSTAVRAYTVITNVSKEPLGIEYVSSFSMYGFGIESIVMFYNTCVNEFEIRECSPEALGYSKNGYWDRITMSNTGSWPSKESLPMGCVKSDDKTILWQIESNCSWTWEISKAAGLNYLKLSGPSERENSWLKELMPQESFKSTSAAVVVTSDGFDKAIAEMTKYRRHIAYRAQKDKNSPVIFNDYMGLLWGDPTTEKEIPLIDMAAKIGAEIYCMDAGWYADGGWWETIGEWEVCEKRFPGGMKKVFDYIHEKGMKAGIWLEPECIGINCPILDKFDDSCFFVRHGRRVIDNGRYQFDYRNKKVVDYMNSVVDRLIDTYGIEYLKLDYNIEIGSGTEVNASSFGDGLLQHSDAYLKWIDGISERHPGIIVENCSSGGNRMDYKSLSHTSLQSITDRHLLDDMAHISAMSAVGILPEQAAVWCAPKVNNTKNENAALMVNAMQRRLHLSGETASLDKENYELIEEAIKVYKQNRNLIDKLVPFYPLGLFTREDDIKCCGFKNEDVAYISVTNLSDEQKDIKIPLGLAKYTSATLVYPKTLDYEIDLCEDVLSIKLPARSGANIELN